MVDLMPSLDATFGAVSDPTRRAILGTLAEGEASVTRLAEPFDMSLQAISKHLGVLAASGLIAREKRGRTYWCRLTAEPMRVADDWIGGYRPFWEDRLDSLGDYLSDRGRR